jgi:HD-GYP domain-containing protein (c-di-GMP phosphodiesterase class II)
LTQAASWDAVLAAEPRLSRRVDGADLDDVLAAMADLIDLKSPYLAGHSRGVANLAEAAARVSGLADDEVIAVRRAGLMHDLGRLGVSNAVWDKPGPLTPAEFERVRLHPYLTERMLARVPALARSREIAARHHERLDGSGYPHGLTAASLGPADRLLAAADHYHAMTEPRPHRLALDPTRAADQLRAQAQAGRLDGEAIHAVLRRPASRALPEDLAGRPHRPRGRGAPPAGPRLPQQADRAPARGRLENGGQPRRTHLREDCRVQPGRGHPIREPARPAG